MFGGAPKTWNDENAKALAETKPKVVAAIAKAGTMLAEAKDRFTSSGETCGEVDYFWTLHIAETVHPGCLGPCQAFYDRLKGTACGKYCDGTSRYCSPETPMWQQPVP